MKIFLLSSLILLNTAWVQAENKTKSYSNANSNSKVGGICKPILSGMKVSVFTFSQSERFVREFQGTKETQIQTVESYIAEFRLGDPSQEYGRMMSLRLNRANNTFEYFSSSMPILQLDPSLSGIVENGLRKQDFYIGRLKSMDMNTNYEVHLVSTSQRSSLVVSDWTPLNSVVSIYKVEMGRNKELRRELIYRINGPGAQLSLKYLASSIAHSF